MKCQVHSASGNTARLKTAAHSRNGEQQKSAVGLGTGIKRTGCSTESWVFTGHALGLSCLRIHGEWLLWNIPFCRSSVKLKIKNMPTNLQMSQQAMAIHSFGSFYVKLFEWRRQTLTTTRNSSAKLMTTFPT